MTLASSSASGGLEPRNLGLLLVAFNSMSALGLGLAGFVNVVTKDFVRISEIIFYFKGEDTSGLSAIKEINYTFYIQVNTSRTYLQGSGNFVWDN